MKLTDFPTYRKNPFLTELFLKESTRLTKIQDTNLNITDSTGDIKGKVVYAKEHNVDRTPFVKLFEFDFLLNIGKSGLTMFVYLGNHGIKYGREQVIILMEDVISRTTYNSESSIYKGLAALVKSKVLARTSSPNIFWLNPAIAYKGERRYLKMK